MRRASDDLSDPTRNLVESTGQSDIPEDGVNIDNSPLEFGLVVKQPTGLSGNSR